MSVVTVSQVLLSELIDQERPDVPLLQRLPDPALNPLPPADASDFVTISRPGLAPFTAIERNAVLAFAQGHPLALQVACFHVVEARRNGEGLYAAMQQAEDDMKGYQRDWRGPAP